MERSDCHTEFTGTTEVPRGSYERKDWRRFVNTDRPEIKHADEESNALYNVCHNKNSGFSIDHPDGQQTHTGDP